MNKENLKTWMLEFQDKNLFDLILPGTHNSTSYDLTYSSFIIGNRISCQRNQILKQLEDGIRAIDLRIIAVKNEDDEIEFWTGHGNRFLPMQPVIDTIFQFLQDNPSEFIFLCVAPDATPMNDKNPFCHCLRKSKDQIMDRMRQEDFERDVIDNIILK